ncbi:MAG: hypothetical protein US95_C0039G0011, partial [Candidatus Woesebacteria bacterium GW2011_GWB1_38_5]
ANTTKAILKNPLADAGIEIVDKV